MLPRLALLLAAGLVAAGCLQADNGPGAVLDPILGDGGLAFSTVAIPGSSEVSEPSIGVDSKGHIYVSAPTGIPSPSPLWKSEDGGKTWKQMVPNPTALGGGDTSIAIGPKDEVYITDLWVGSSTISVTLDGGKTWSSTPIASQVPYYDREWNTVDQKGNAYHLARAFTPGATTWVSRSEDQGKTWVHAGNPWVNPESNSQNGPFINNPKTDEIAVVYDCVAKDGVPVPFVTEGSPAVCVSISKDLGMTWRQSVAAKAQGNVGNIFPAFAADRAGNWYVAWSESTAEGTALRWAWSADGAKWSEPRTLLDGPGNRVFPWMSAGDAGRIAISWYGTETKGDSNDANAMKDAQWRLMTAISVNALDASPAFVSAAATSEPVHTGTVSTQGLSPDGPDRSLGDFFMNTVGPDGRVHLAFMKSLDGGNDIAALYSVQTGGPLLYANPAAGGAAASPTPSAGGLPVPLPPVRAP